MTSHIAADEQRMIRMGIEEIRRITQQIFARLETLDRTDQRVVRTEQALCAIDRLSWSISWGPDSFGPPANVRAILEPLRTGDAEGPSRNYRISKPGVSARCLGSTTRHLTNEVRCVQS